MNTIQWIVAIWIALSALLVFGKGCAGYKQTYTIGQGIFGLIECGVMIWLVAQL